MNYFQEAKLRWKGDTPDWFKKTQKILAAGAVLGGVLAGISVTSSKLSWITVIGGSLSALCTGGIAVSTFVVSSIGIILEPGDSIENKTSNTVEVKPATDQAATPLVVTPVQPESILPPPADPGTP